MKKWVKALRSGKFKQGTGTLFKETENSYCCLGVLCAINELDLYGDLLYSGQSESLGMSSDNGKLPKKYKGKGREVDSLADLNDEGRSFKQIANIIERNYKDL